MDEVIGPQEAAVTGPKLSCLCVGAEVVRSELEPRLLDDSTGVFCTVSHASLFSAPPVWGFDARVFDWATMGLCDPEQGWSSLKTLVSLSVMGGWGCV